MKSVELRGLVLAAIVLLALCLTVLGQSPGRDTTKHKAKAHPYKNLPYAPNSELNNSGSSANVRHELTGSNNPGHVFGPTGKTGPSGNTGPTGH